MDILGPDRGKTTIYGSDFQQVNLTLNGGVSPTVIITTSFFIFFSKYFFYYFSLKLRFHLITFRAFRL